ncbi:MAG TPA: hypothetical protein VJQ06_05135 [Rhizomicrobium sp.]|nr:hypothetical protein [Rhizomicrobium sp.]
MGAKTPVFAGWSRDGLLGGIDLSESITAGLSFLLGPTQIDGAPAISGADKPLAAPRPYQRMSAAYDGVCRLPDGSLHPYVDTGDGYANIYGAGNLNTNGQMGLGSTAGNGAEPTLAKPGGVGGGGKSGKFTSRASSAARNFTGRAKFGLLEPITGTASIGGSIARSIPMLGGALMLSDWLEHYYAPVCTPISDPTRIY